MIRQLPPFLYGFLFMVILSLTGCPPPATPKPESSPSSPGTGGSAGGSSGGERKSPSSMEAHRRGRVPAAPASSPLKDIYFDFDRYSLRAEARATLKESADWLNANPSARVEIEGHCDERGTNEYNLALGAKRAQSAKDYLVTLGVSGGRISTISYGEELPACREKTEGCWQRNRRDRFVVVTSRPAS